MPKLSQYGLGEDCNYMPSTAVDDATVSVVSKMIDMSDKNTTGIQLIAQSVTESVPVEEGDGADNSDSEITLAGFDFTGLEDATIRIQGSESNDGDFVITAGADGSAAVTPAPTDETFDPDAVTVTLIHTEDPIKGTWAVEVSNNYTAPSNGSAYGAVPGNEGDWTDITAFFSPTIAAVDGTDADDDSLNQPVQADLAFHTYRVTYTPDPSAPGAGTVKVLGFSKSFG